MTRGVPEPPPRGVFLDEMFDTMLSGSLGLAAAALGAQGVRAAIQHNKALVRLIRLDHGLPVSLKRLRRA